MTQPKRKLILGSSSEPRRALLERLLLPFEVASPDIDETPLKEEAPADLVLRLAVQKAEKVATLYPDALIIAADQVGVLHNEIQGKPLNYETAYKQLHKASGQHMRFHIGLCLLDTRNNAKKTSLETFDVIYRMLTPETIQKYLQKEQPYQCAGSCKAEGLGIALIEEFQGKDFTALIGLPMIRLVTMLNAAGLNPIETD